MKPAQALTTGQREQRKQNLLLASRLARGQAVVAIDELAGRADAVAHQVVRVREGIAGALTWTTGSAVGSLLLGWALRRVRVVRRLRWVWPAWQLWRIAAAAMAGYRAEARPGSSGPR